MINLRIRSPSGPSTVSLADDATLADLRVVVEEKTSIYRTRQDLRWGFPPLPLDPAASPSATLTSLGVTTGETIIVAEGTAETTTAESSSTSASSSSATSSVPQKRAVSPSVIPSAVARAAPFARIDSLPATPLFATEKQTTSKPSPRVVAPPKPSSTPHLVEVDGGYLVQRVVPDDNSCLFHAVGIALSQAADAPASLRRVVAGAIQADPETWSEVVLGRSPSSYIETILSPNSWGGAVELAVLAARFSTEIWSLDVKTGRVDRFGEDQGFETFVLLVYSGIHYDALTFSYAPPEPSIIFPPPNLDFDTTCFSIATQDHLLEAAKKLVTKLRAEHAYTDTATFTLRCGDCKEGLTGEKDAREHAKKTGHTNFTEYDG